LKGRPIARKAPAVNRAARTVSALPLAGIAAAATCWLTGCPSTAAATVYTPITGIVIHSADLVEGHGCGTGPDQVYEYLAVLAYTNTPDKIDKPYTSTVVSCYADGILSNLQGLPVSGSSNLDFDFKVYIYAYDFASFPQSLACTPDTASVLAGSCPGDALCATTKDCNSGGLEPLHPPTWKTTCTGTEQAGIPVLASCGALEPTGDVDGGAPPTITIGSQEFLVADGGIVACGVNYQSTSASWTIADSGGEGSAPAAPCSEPIVVSPALADAEYTIELSLLGDPDAGEVARTRCTAIAAAGANTYASCSPAQLGP
jgi:hypothetical protein